LSLRELEQVVPSEPDNMQARMALGFCLLQINKLPEALVELERVLNSQPNNLAVAYALGTTYIELRELDKAQKLINQTFRQLNTVEAHALMGSYYIASRELKKGIDELVLAKQINPNLPTLHSTLGTAYLQSHDRERAAEEFVAELKINPNDFAANLLLGRIYREDKRLDEAAVLLKQALEVRSNDTEALYQMAQLLQARDSLPEAITLLERVVKDDPYYIAAHVLLARLYYKVQRTADGDRERAEIQRLNDQEQRLYIERQKKPTSPESSAAETGKAAGQPKKP